MKICAPAKDALAALRDVRGVGRVEQLSERDGDAATFVVDSDSGVDIRKAVFFLCAERNWPLVGFEQVGLDLEEVFLRLVNKTGDADTRRKKK